MLGGKTALGIIFVQLQFRAEKTFRSDDKKLVDWKAVVFKCNILTDIVIQKIDPRPSML